MGLFGTIAAFAGGYVAGMKMGDRPIVAARSMMSEARARASSLAASAGSLGSRAAGGATVDLRTVREVMSAPPETVRPDTPLRDAAKAMQRGDIGDVLVVNEVGELRGILTDRDLAIRAVAEHRDPATAEVGEIMSPIVATLPPAATVHEALDLMRRHDVRRLPVVEDGRPVGIVSLGDLSPSSRAGAALEDISTAPANN